MQRVLVVDWQQCGTVFDSEFYWVQRRAVAVLSKKSYTRAKAIRAEEEYTAQMIPDSCKATPAV